MTLMPNTMQKTLVALLLFLLSAIFVHSELEMPHHESADSHQQHDFCRLVQATQLVKIERGYSPASFQLSAERLAFDYVLKPLFANRITDFSRNLFIANNSPLSLFDILVI